MADLLQAHPHLQLLWIGPFNEPFVEKQVKAYAIERGVDRAINHIPLIPHEDVPDYLVQSQLGLIPWQTHEQMLRMNLPIPIKYSSTWLASCLSSPAGCPVWSTLCTTLAAACWPMPGCGRRTPGLSVSFWRIHRNPHSWPKTAIGMYTIITIGWVKRKNWSLCITNSHRREGWRHEAHGRGARIFPRNIGLCQNAVRGQGGLGGQFCIQKTFPHQPDPH